MMRFVSVIVIATAWIFATVTVIERTGMRIA
jgi:hypothetical protein